tara:strand:- start:805 stop:1134 length:330 start_codon:yes stop_codon:yes gene_type:complete
VYGVKTMGSIEVNKAKIETTIAEFLKFHYGKWYTVEELNKIMKINKRKLALAAERLYHKNDHIWRRLYDWRTPKNAKVKLYKYRDRTRTEQEEINTKMMEWYLGTKLRA